MTGERFREYVEEFRGFSRTHNVGFGHPHDLLMLPYAMQSSERFRVEMASMVRSVFYREGGNLTQPEVLRLVATAWGGGDEPLPEAMMMELEDFVREVLTRAPGEPQPIMVEEETGSEAAAERTESVRQTMASAFARKAKEESGRAPVAALVVESKVVESQSGVVDDPWDEACDDPWVDGSFLHRELMQFAEWRAAR